MKGELGREKMFVLQWNQITRLATGSLLCYAFSYYLGQGEERALQNTSYALGANGFKSLKIAERVCSLQKVVLLHSPQLCLQALLRRHH